MVEVRQGVSSFGVTADSGLGCKGHGCLVAPYDGSLQPASPAGGSVAVMRPGICWLYNEGYCRFYGLCRFKHEYSTRRANHPTAKCPRRQKPSSRPLVSRRTPVSITVMGPRFAGEIAAAKLRLAQYVRDSIALRITILTGREHNK